MTQAEAMISKHFDTVGIGVGLYTDYGPAQRMYVVRSYVPDGQGCTYKNEPVSGGQRICADDNLVVWFSKRLR